jgi:hypothetical protein
LQETAAAEAQAPSDAGSTAPCLLPRFVGVELDAAAASQAATAVAALPGMLAISSIGQ